MSATVEFACVFVVGVVVVAVAVELTVFVAHLNNFIIRILGDRIFGVHLLIYFYDMLRAAQISTQKTKTNKGIHYLA